MLKTPNCSVDLASLAVPGILEEVFSHPESNAIRIFHGSGLDFSEPFRNAVWITCKDATPHQDPDFANKRFLTLAVQADHVYGEVGKSTYRQMLIEPGVFFSTNPLSLHWLRNRDFNQDNRFVGLQWELDAVTFKEQALAIIEAVANGAVVTPLEFESRQLILS